MLRPHHSLTSLISATPLDVMLDVCFTAVCNSEIICIGRTGVHATGPSGEVKAEGGDEESDLQFGTRLDGRF